MFCSRIINVITRISIQGCSILSTVGVVWLRNERNRNSSSLTKDKKCDNEARKRIAIAMEAF